MIRRSADGGSTDSGGVLLGATLSYVRAASEGTCTLCLWRLALKNEEKADGNF